MKRLLQIILSFLIAFNFGCNSITYHTLSKVDRARGDCVSPGPYQGVRHDVRGFGWAAELFADPNPEGSVLGAAIFTMALLFLPFDFFADTVFLPYDITQIAKKNPPDAETLAKSFMSKQDFSNQYSKSYATINEVSKEISIVNFELLSDNSTYGSVRVDLESEQCTWMGNTKWSVQLNR